ncbi:MAG: AAA family ATPase [Beutenbergiaceae bacterium]
MLGAADPLPYRPARVLVAGVSGSGKTTLADRIGSVLAIEHTELDGLFHGPGWTPRPEFEADVQTLVTQPRWVTEWQYRPVRCLLLSRADMLVWLDHPYLLVTLPRVVRRTLVRRVRRVRLWNGNVEPPLRTFLTDRDHIVRWSVRTRDRYRKHMPAVVAERPELPVVRLGDPRQVERWVHGPLRHAAAPPYPGADADGSGQRAHPGA